VGAVSDREISPIAVGDRSYKTAVMVLPIAVGDRSCMRPVWERSLTAKKAPSRSVTAPTKTAVMVLPIAVGDRSCMRSVWERSLTAKNEVDPKVRTDLMAV
jgi:hypothetical protein